VHGRSGEQASEAPSVEIQHRETSDNVFGEHLGATARLRLISSLSICILFVRLDDFALLIVSYFALLIFHLQIC
jgi:hypothetical protein